MPKKKDLTGQRFGRLTVIKECPERKNGKIYWVCKCDCGNETTVIGTNLTRGQTQSCGCYKRDQTIKSNKEKFTGKVSEKRINEIGHRYGKLLVLEEAESVQGKAAWLCQCDCGNQLIVKGKYLRNGDTKSCGCLRSAGQEKIAKLLRENNIPFVQEKTFESCRFKDTGKLARFDFYVDNKYLIEFDGIQHFKQTGWRTEEEFQRDLDKDNFKTLWAKENNIPLIRIKYNRLQGLSIEDLLLDSNLNVV